MEKEDNKLFGLSTIKNNSIKMESNINELIKMMNKIDERLMNMEKKANKLEDKINEIINT